MKNLARRVRIHRFTFRAFLLLILAVVTASQVRAQSCTPPPTGIVAWWQAENNGIDSVGSAPGMLVGDETFGPGEVGEAFSSPGSGSGVLVTNTTELQLQTFTIEGWLKRRGSTVSSGSGGNGFVVGFGNGGYIFWMDPSGALQFNKLGDPAISSSVSIQDLNFHHVAVTLGAGQVRFYIDGVNAGSAAYGPTFAFSGPFGIGFRPDNGDNSFNGRLDEISIYNRVLGANEMQSIYNAGSGGKCLDAGPVFSQEPVSQSQVAGGTAVFSAAIVGNQLLSYQWTFDGTILAGGTNGTLVLSDVQVAEAGVYALTVSNAYGVATSSNAFLTVEPAPPCISRPAGLVAWWRGELNTVDTIGNGNGTLAGNEGYGAGEVGSGFTGGGSGDGVLITNTTALQLQTLTIETWIKRGSPIVVSHGSGGNAIVVGFGNNGYAIYLNGAGVPVFSVLGQSQDQTGTVAITDAGFHHLAASVGGGTLKLYLDGTNINTFAYSPTFAFTSDFGIGYRPDNADNSFLGTIDEISIYNRVLTPSEIQAIFANAQGGKCFDVPPAIVQQPASQSVYAGRPAVFAVSASGAKPLAYQWLFNGTNLSGANDPTLVLPDAQLSQAGIYSVVVSNVYDVVTSTNVTLTVNPPPACFTPPAGMVGWWRADNNAFDYSDNGGDGVLIGSEGYGPGEVISGFVGDGSNEGVLVTNTAALQLQNLTIEAWIRRGSSSVISHGSGGNAIIAGFGANGYALYLNSGGVPIFSVLNQSRDIGGSTPVTDTNFHHVAACVGSGTINLYLDATNIGNYPYSPNFAFTSGFGIGFRPDNQDNGFLGTIDELAIYNRALTLAEIEGIYNASFGGKCYSATAPIFTRQPADERVPAGETATLISAVAGAPPVSYQWFFNGVILSNAIRSALVITNLQAGNAGVYSVIASNLLGSVSSTNAMLAVDVVSIYVNGTLQTNSPVLYSETVTLEFTNYYSDGDIFYTVDGTTPTPFSAIYTGPLTVTNSVVLNTLAYSPDFQESAYSVPFSILIVPSYSLTAATPGGGTISVSPLTNSYTSNTLVTITATASNGWTFLRWSGDAFGGGQTNTVLLTRDKSVQAIFGTTVGRESGVGGTVNFNPPGPLFPYGSILRATAFANPGNEFVLWGESASGNTNPLPFAVLAPNLSISALFIKTPTNQFSLAVLAQGGGGVSTSPQALSYVPGQTVTITATPNPGESFLGWSGDAAGNQNPLTLVMNQSHQVIARFSANISLSISLYDSGADDAGIQLEVLGQIGQHFRLDSSANLDLWTPLLDTTNYTGTLQYLDAGNTSLPVKYYRAVILP